MAGYLSLPRPATRVIDEVKGVNRVIYDITSKPPGKIEWEWQVTSAFAKN